MRAKSIIVTIFIFFLIIPIAFSIDYNVQIYNQTKQEITGYICSADNIGSQSPNIILSQKVLPNSNYIGKVKVDRNTVIIGYAIYANGGQTDQSYKLASKNNDTYTLVVTSTNERDLQSLTTEKLLQYDPTKYLENDATPKPIDALFTNFLGGIVLYEISGKSLNILTTISPSELGVAVKPYYGTMTSSQDIVFANQLTQSIKGSIPAISELGLTWDSSSLYKVKMEYSKIGVIDYSPLGEISIPDKFKNLKPASLYNLGGIKAAHNNLIAKQINQAYVFEAIYIEVNQGSKIGATSKIDASTFFTSQGNYSISNSTTAKKVIGNSYLGYWCSQTAQDYTNMLDYAVAVYNTSNIRDVAPKSSDDAIALYKKLREDNPNLPDLKTKEEITTYFQKQLDAYKAANPQNKNDEKLNPLLVQPVSFKLNTYDFSNALSSYISRNHLRTITPSNIESALKAEDPSYRFRYSRTEWKDLYQALKNTVAIDNGFQITQDQWMNLFEGR